jgi:hypothetical protein
MVRDVFQDPNSFFSDLGANPVAGKKSDLQ